MKIMYRSFVFFLFLVPLFSSGQSNVNAIMIKLNKVHKTGRIFGNKVTTIYLNKSDNTVDIDDAIIYLSKVELHYEFRNEAKINKSAVSIDCIQSGCMLIRAYKNSPLIQTSGTTIFFKTKEASYQFINLFVELQKEIQAGE